MTIRVAILDDYQRVATRFFGPGLPPDVEPETFSDHLGDPEEVVQRLEPFDVVVAMRERTPFPRDVLARLPRLRLLVTTGMHNAAIDLDGAAAEGVLVCGTGGPGHPTAELTLGLMLALARRIPQEDAALRAGAWQTTLGVTLRGRRLGLIGLGRLGRQVASLALAFGMEVGAWSQNLTQAGATEVGVEREATLEGLLRSADIVSIHTRLSDRTRGLLGRDELRVMKRTALLVNTSRGPIVDTAALVDALRNGAIAGAALDVYDEEPLPAEHPLRTAPNTVLTPHLGYVSEESYEVFFREAREDLEAFLAGSPVRCLNEPARAGATAAE